MIFLSASLVSVLLFFAPSNARAVEDCGASLEDAAKQLWQRPFELKEILDLYHVAEANNNEKGRAAYLAIIHIIMTDPKMVEARWVFHGLEVLTSVIKTLSPAERLMASWARLNYIRENVNTSEGQQLLGYAVKYSFYHDKTIAEAAKTFLTETHETVTSEGINSVVSQLRNEVRELGYLNAGGSFLENPFGRATYAQIEYWRQFYRLSRHAIYSGFSNRVRMPAREIRQTWEMSGESPDHSAEFLTEVLYPARRLNPDIAYLMVDPSRVSADDKMRMAQLVLNNEFLVQITRSIFKISNDVPLSPAFVYAQIDQALNSVKNE